MTNYVSLFSNINIMKTLKVRHRKNKRHGKNRVKHKSNRIRTRRRKLRAGGVSTSWVGSGLGFGSTGFNHIGNIFKQIAKRTLLIN